MMEYNEQDFLSLSGIQHFAFCRRQWALIHIEQQWGENLRTVEGELLHERAHDGYSSEKRKDIIVSRGMAVFSRTLGINGVCDIVEFVRDDDIGVGLFGREGKYKAYPVEYKRGKPKENDVDILQLVAQAMCLEEMLSCDITEGFIFYGETRHRNKVEITDALRARVKAICAEMHQYYERRYTPLVKLTKSCNACSLKDICMPKLCRKKSAKLYMEKLIKESDSI
jgi:CRISPR-associated exonuclease Cas4